MLRPMQNDSIVLSGVSVDRGGRRVLHEIDLTLTERRIALIGKNGSGKSTLIRLLNGLLQPAVGELSVFGLNPEKRSRELLRTVGFIFQNPDHQIIFPTVEEELAFGLRQLGANQRDANHRARQFLEEHGKSDWAERPVHDLSEGQKQLVCILAILVMEPRILVLDEPFSSLDLPTRLALDRFIDDLPLHIIMISHDDAILAGYDRILWLEDGHIHRDGRPETVLPEFRVAMEAAADTLFQERCA